MRTLGILAALMALSGSARGGDAAAPPVKRRVAVLEFRAGAEGAAGVAERMATLLGKSTSLDVVGPANARQLAGERLDQEVARCQGDAACVATIGRKLGAAEVLLVGVNEFGDLIVAIQRIGVAERAALARLAESFPKGTEPDDAALQGYLKRLLPPSDFRRFGAIHIRANVDGAVVTVDGQRRGTTPLEQLIVAAPSRVEIRVHKAGYQEFRARLDVLPDSTVEVRPTLTRGAASGAWYKKWWIWAIAGSVATGAVAGAVVWGSSEPTQVPVIVKW